MQLMNRRYALGVLAAASFLVSSARSAVVQPFRMSLLAGSLKEGVWQAGILIALESGWKTYWRMPGDTGIPPSFDWTGSTNNTSVEVGFPVTRRFNDEGGETIGYHDQALFPIFVKPGNGNEPVHLQLNMFFAVCKEVCIPARANASLVLKSSSENQVLNDWQQRVPRALATGTAPPVTAVRLETRQTKPMLVLSLSREVLDIFVESETTAYFGKPQFDVAPQEAWLPIVNLKDMQKLRGAVLKLTLSFGDSGIEQTLVIT